MNRKLASYTFRASPVESDSGEDTRTLRFLGSTEDVARDGGILSLDGWEVDDYIRNPVFLWAHDANQPPIGRTTKVERADAGLMFDVEFATPDINPFADLVYRLYRAGFMRAVSVGFEPQEMRPPNDAERDRGAHWVSTRQTLLELSGVPVGADANALKVARGVVSRADVRFLRHMGPDAFTRLAREASMEPVKIRDPDAFPEGTEFHEVDLGDGIVGIAGELEGEVVLQGIRFPEEMSEEDASSWLDAFDGEAWRQEEEEEDEEAPPEDEDEEDEMSASALAERLRDLADLIETSFTRNTGGGDGDAGAGDGDGPRAHAPTSTPGADNRLMDLARKYAGK